MKQLYKKEPVDYIMVLPPSPTQLLREWPNTATKVFSMQSPPATCPLKPEVVASVRSKIVLRGGAKAKAVPGVHDMLSAVRGTLLHSLHVLCTLHAHAFVYMR